jgi:uncharacterized protein (DUF952 family)
MIVHICEREAWEVAQKNGEYRAASLDTVGYIHCSRPEQLLDVANRFYREVPELLLLWIDPHKVKSEIRWEAADGETYPHIYGPLDIEAVTIVTALIPDENGAYSRLRLKPLIGNRPTQ